jgi:NAD-dependent SIR2 family protein deacetylase
MTKREGHFFIIQGDLTKLSCDGILIPCDDEGNVSRWWFEVFQHEPQAGGPWEPLRPGATLRSGPTGPIAHELVDTVSVGGDIDRLVATVQDGVARLADRVHDKAGAGRVLPLLALPMPGTGQGGLAHRRGAVVRALVPCLAQTARQLGIDLVLVDRDRRDFAALQSVRKQTQWDLSPKLSGDADRLGELVAWGQVSVFVGAGVSVPLGLPGWAELVNTLRKNASLPPVPQRSGEPMLLEAAAQAKSALGARYNEVLGECLDVGHHALGHGLLASMRVRQTVTTNFDRALEHAMSTTHGEGLKVLTSQWAGQAAPWLLKLHGTAGRSAVVLTKEDYDRHRDEDGQPLYALVQGLLMTSHLLFVGFSMTDSNYLRLAEPVAKLYSRAGGKEKVATVLGLKSLANEQRALDNAVQHISFDEERRGAGEAARTLEIFLDRVAWRAATLQEEAHAFLLDERYADLVEGQEQELKGALIQLQTAVAGLSGPGAERVRAQLRELGASKDDLDRSGGKRTYR